MSPHSCSDFYFIIIITIVFLFLFFFFFFFHFFLARVIAAVPIVSISLVFDSSIVATCPSIPAVRFAIFFRVCIAFVVRSCFVW